MQREIKTSDNGRTNPFALNTYGRGSKVLPITPEHFYQSFTAPAGKTFLLYGESAIFKLSLYFASLLLSKNVTVAVVDGCNRFDVHFITRFARERGGVPDEFLQRIFVSRGFTCYQMEAVIANRLPAFFKSHDATFGMIFGLLDTFYDEQAPLREVQQMLNRLLVQFQEMNRSGHSLLLACNDWKILPKERNQLFAQLKQNVDNVYHAVMNEDQQPKLFLEQHQTKGVVTNGQNRPDIYQHY
ncbi:MAG: hypothetical protein HYZ34_05880 [Ignavibacteriae bacterium]|nr:hypothetical protein [Ignavibacteriota bacterium]